jgi:succinyl-CoA synthetase beta subunit
VGATLDLVYQAGGKPANYLNVGDDAGGEVTSTSLCDRLEQGLKKISENQRIKVVLINILGSVTACDGIAGIIAKYLPSRAENLPAITVTKESWGHSNGAIATPETLVEVEVRSPTHYPQFVVRLAGSYLAAAKEHLSTLGVCVVDKLDEAVSQAIALANQ